MNMFKLERSQKGLTIVEVILVASIMAIIALTLYNAIANGLKVWDRVHRFSAEEDIALFLEDIAVNLHNSVEYGDMLFDGERSSISFSTVVQVRVDPNVDPTLTSYTHQIGRVRYSFDKSSQDLYRQEANYSLALQNKYFDKQSLVHPLKSVEFIYYTVKEERLVEMPQTQEWPAMVKIIVHYEGSRGQESVIEKSVILPRYSTGNV